MVGREALREYARTNEYKAPCAGQERRKKMITIQLDKTYIRLERYERWALNSNSCIALPHPTHPHPRLGLEIVCSALPDLVDRASQDHAEAVASPCHAIHRSAVGTSHVLALVGPAERRGGPGRLRCSWKNISDKIRE